jgi:hypothetical protein
MKPHHHPIALAALLALATAGSAHAQVFGSLANFDAVNDTGHEAHGFEIQLEGVHRSDIYSVFGLDRDFGPLGITTVERYGAPTLTDSLTGVTVRYAATFDLGTGLYSKGTPTGPYAFPGDSCWPGGNPAYLGGTLTCDHFGVATYGNPAKVTYSWLVDPGNTGTLTLQQAAIPAVNFVYNAPAPGNANPAPVVAEIEAHKADNEVFGTAYWVKIFAKHVDHQVKLEDLMKHNADVPNDQQVETEFELFQAGDLGGNGKKANNLFLNPGDEALVLRYEFYKYLGAVDGLGEALCSGKGGGGKGGGGGGGKGPADCGGLGDYVGAQMAGFNAVQPPLPAVPEPQTWALMLAGLAGLGRLIRRRA